jgi:hypothetical protein
VGKLMYRGGEALDWVGVGTTLVGEAQLCE